MKTLLTVLVSCCGLLLLGAPPVAASTPSPTQLTTVSGTDENTFDPYIGQGDLITKAVPVCCCSTWNANCADVPAGTHCNPNSNNCKCSAQHTCVNAP